MHTPTKLALASMTAAFALALAVSSASAGRLSFSHTLMRTTFNPLTFSGPFGAFAKCPITLESSYHAATITKVIGTLLGAVTRAIRGTCSQGGVTVLSETLPWHLQYGGIVGTLPRFTGVKERVVGFALRFQESVFGINCLMRTTEAVPLIGIFEGITYEASGNGIVTRLVLEPNASIPCGSTNFAFEGTGSVTDNTGARNVLIRLI